MNRFLFHACTLAAAVFAVPSVGSAQLCYESNIGTSVGVGDDVVLPIQSIGFAFPFGGATYTDIHPCTNGFVYLSNAGVPAPGGALYPTFTPAALVAGSPKICPMLTDLNILAANGAAVYVNNTIPGRCVVTWLNAVMFGNTVIETIQMQLYSSGNILFFYDTNVLIRTASAALAGMSPAGGAAVPPASNLSNGGNVTVPTLFETFNNTTAQCDLTGASLLFVPNGAGYIWTFIPCSALNLAYGAGCYNSTRTLYEHFPSSNTFDLSGLTITFTPAGGAYVVTSAPIGAFFAPVAAALALTDDSIAVGNALPSPFPYPGTNTAAVDVHSNGQVFLSGGGVADYTATVAEFLTRGASVGAWMDFNPAAAGSGGVHFDVDAINNVAYVTWNGVYAYGTATPHTMQIALYCNGSVSPGTMELRFQSLANNATLDPNCITGYTPGNNAQDPGNRDLSAVLPVVVPAEARGLLLTAAPGPSLGATVTYTLDRIPLTAILSAHIVSFTQVPAPGVDLGFLGAGGCVQLIGLSGSSNVLMFGSPTATRNLTIPNVAAYAGMVLFSQGATLVVGVNPLGLLTSNAIASYVF
jgi:hypothetical protein